MTINRRDFLKFSTLLSTSSLLPFMLDSSAEAAIAASNPLITNKGIKVADFTGAKWKDPWQTGARLTRNFNSLALPARTPVTGMLRWGPITAAYETIQLNTSDLPGGAPLVLRGRFGLWMYCANQRGYGPGQEPDTTFHIVMTTAVDLSFDNAVDISFNANQIREGWNFLKYVDNPKGHPMGIDKAFWGDGSGGDIVNNPVTAIQIYCDAPDIGATWYFDSLWTGFTTKPQIVLGCDDANDSLLNYCIPQFKQVGWIGYIATPYRVWESGSYKVTRWVNNPYIARALNEAPQWDIINHTVNHLRVGDLTRKADITYELTAQTTWLRSQGVPDKGLMFYASPQSSSSRLSDKTIKSLGFTVQRHYRKQNTCLTQFGIDNPQHIGAFALDDQYEAQSFDKIKAAIDIVIAYEDTSNLYWHDIIDDSNNPQDGISTTGNSYSIYKSTWDKVMHYIRTLELDGKVTIAKGMTGFVQGNI
ncbi:MAG: hypothetical protein ABL903_11225 [Methylococcales bacterium]